MKKWYLNLAFRHKVATLCMIISILPVIIIGTYSYNKLQSVMEQREKEVLSESLNKAVETLEFHMSTYMNIMSFIIWDRDLQQTLSIDYDNNFDMYMAYKEIIDPLFNSIRNLHQEIKDITIYTNNTIHPHGNTLRPLSDLKHGNWYEFMLNARSATFVISEESKEVLLFWRLLDSNNNFTHIIVLNIDYDATFNSFNNLFEENFGVMVIADDGTPLYVHEAFNYPTLNLPSEGSKMSIMDYEDQYVIAKKGIHNYNYAAYLYRPTQTILDAARNITITVILVVIGCILFVLWASHYFSKIIVRPLEKLSKNMVDIENGNDLTVTVTQKSDDEVGMLIHQFTSMVSRLRFLINEVYKNKIKKQEYEMKALQAQINPHFLYNSLSLINSKAIMSDQEDIGLMARHLSSFYRTSLNKGKDLIAVEDELVNVSSYITIQSLLHSNSFDVIYNIKEDIRSYAMLNLLLQPLVENAIEHGIDHRTREGKGLVTINGYEKDDCIIFTVEDNGCGMTEDVLKTLLTNKSSGYGVKNVHSRVQLYYGEEYGLFYESTLEIGTKVTLRLPLSKPE